MPLPSVFESDSRGEPFVGTSIESQSFKLSVAAAAQAVLEMRVTPAGSGESTTTAKVRLKAEPPPGIGPRAKVQVEPGPELGVQVHPELLAELLNVVWAGTVSESATEATP